MNGPHPICAGCEKPTTWHKPICDDCLRAAGETPRPYCALCDVVGLKVDRHGIHTTKTGGYAGMCAAHTSFVEHK